MTIDGDDVVAFGMIAAVLSVPLAFITHLVWTIQMLMAGSALAGGQVALMLVGLVLPPIGVLHGYVLWFS